MVPPANEKPMAGGHVSTVVPFGSWNWRKDMFMYVCTYLTEPETEGSVLPMSNVAASTWCWAMILFDSKSEIRKPGPLGCDRLVG